MDQIIGTGCILDPGSTVPLKEYGSPIHSGPEQDCWIPLAFVLGEPHMGRPMVVSIIPKNWCGNKREKEQ